MAQVSDGELVGQTSLEGLNTPIYATEEQLVVLRHALVLYAMDREQRRDEIDPMSIHDPKLRDREVELAMTYDQHRALAADMALDVERLLRQLRES